MGDAVDETECDAVHRVLGVLVVRGGRTLGDAPGC